MGWWNKKINLYLKVHACRKKCCFVFFVNNTIFLHVEFRRWKNSCSSTILAPNRSGRLIVQLWTQNVWAFLNFSRRSRYQLTFEVICLTFGVTYFRSQIELRWTSAWIDKPEQLQCFILNFPIYFFCSDLNWHDSTDSSVLRALSVSARIHTCWGITSSTITS